jgi:hypothetical protein
MNGIEKELVSSRLNARNIIATLFPNDESALTFDQFVERLTPHPQVKKRVAAACSDDD